MFNQEVVMKTILVPVDFSDVTEVLIRAAKTFASSMGSRVVLLHVRHPEVQLGSMPMDQIPVTPASIIPVPPVAASTKEFSLIESWLDTLKEKFSGSSIEVAVMQREGQPVDLILEECEKQEAGMIIIGSHGHGALYNLLLGSVTAGVLKSTKCPVLVVPSPRE
jgi:nucleotide-binding universal stress UspA family protein